MYGYECRIEKDSVTKYGERLVTFVATFPRIILAEVNTHKMLSKSSASSRAIPVEKQIDKVMNTPFYPVHWGKNQKGMQAEVDLDRDDQILGYDEWLRARDSAVEHVRRLLQIGVHKQITNRLLEPFLWHKAIISGTEWANFFNLRDNPKAQPEFRDIAHMMREMYNNSTPTLCYAGRYTTWHLPFSDDLSGDTSKFPEISAGRCARISYETHDGKRDQSEDIRLAKLLRENGHMAPYEHVARPMKEFERDSVFKQFHREWDAVEDGWDLLGTDHFCGNFNGWVQMRKMIRGEANILGAVRS